VDARDRCGVGPAECDTHAHDARAPRVEQSLVDFDAGGLQYRSDIGEVEVETGEAA
jgi:hypothetical protein